ncbi:MAG TPA: hypothetical protein VGM90_39430 [Kofleriaceae bacterium]
MALARRNVLILALVLLGACGRRGFDALSDASVDSGRPPLDARPDVPAGSCGPIDDLVDGFDTTQPLPVWDNYPGSAVGQSQVGSELLLVLPNGEGPPAYGGLTSKCAYDLRGRSIVLAIDMVPTRVTGTNMGIEISSGNDGALLEQNGVQLIASTSVGTALTTQYSTTFDIATHKFFALEEDAGDVVWLTSQDGATFVEVARFGGALVDTSQVYVDVYAGTYKAVGNPGRASFTGVSVR